MPLRVNPVGFQWDLHLRGYSEVRRHLNELIHEMPQEVARAAKEELQIEKKISFDRTPWLTHTLQRSHRVIEPEIRHGIIYTGITVGNSETVRYDIIVHEDLEMFHPHGEAKFLEKTMRESGPHLASRIAARVDLKRMAGF